MFQLRYQQDLKVSPEELWNFISTPKNLSKITPDYMNFQILTQNLPEKAYPGMIIAYKVSPVRGIRTGWVTEITHVEEGKYFVDEQRIGPYNMWHHEHHIYPIEGGTRMIDIISYQPPFGILGDILNGVFIKKKIESIFEYRKGVLEDLFKA